MRLSYCAAVLAALFCSPLLAEQQYRIELILFRQGPVLLASRPAPDDWAQGARLLGNRDYREPALMALAAQLVPDQATRSCCIVPGGNRLPTLRNRSHSSRANGTTRTTPCRAPCACSPDNT